MTERSVLQQAAEEMAFVHQVARMIFELQDTDQIVQTWKRFAEERRAASDDGPGVERDLISVLIAILDESKRMASAHVAAAAGDQSDALAGLKKDLEGAQKDLEAQDRMGNFEIQLLMSEYSQAETLASSVLKKRDDAGNAVIQKI